MQGADEWGRWGEACTPIGVEGGVLVGRTAEGGFVMMTLRPGVLTVKAVGTGLEPRPVVVEVACGGVEVVQSQDEGAIGTLDLDRVIRKLFGSKKKARALVKQAFKPRGGGTCK